MASNVQWNDMVWETTDTHSRALCFIKSKKHINSHFSVWWKKCQIVMENALIWVEKAPFNSYPEKSNQKYLVSQCQSHYVNRSHAAFFQSVIRTHRRYKNKMVNPGFRNVQCETSVYEYPSIVKPSKLWALWNVKQVWKSVKETYCMRDKSLTRFKGKLFK